MLQIQIGQIGQIGHKYIYLTFLTYLTYFLIFALSPDGLVQMGWGRCTQETLQGCGIVRETVHGATHWCAKELS